MENSDLESLKLSRATPSQIRIIQSILNDHGIKFKIERHEVYPAGKSSTRAGKFILTFDRESFYSLFDFLMLVICQYEEQEQEIRALQREVSEHRPGIAFDFRLRDVNPYRDNLDAEDHIDVVTDELVFRGVEYNIIGDDMQFEYASAESLLSFTWFVLSQYIDNNQRIAHEEWRCRQQ